MLETEPRFIELHYYIGLSAAFAGKIDESMEHLLLAYSWRPRWPAVTNALAADYIALEEFDKAIEFYDHTLEVLPAFPDALLGKAKAQTYAGGYTEASARSTACWRSSDGWSATRVTGAPSTNCSSVASTSRGTTSKRRRS